ncbi:MAG: anaerobic ribonucleoside-triphosphate reductase [Dehalococcoidia bacterium]|jgi:anaerobic ribonucleoside-triphosphate reductase
MNAKVTELMETIGISRQAAIEIVAMDINSARSEKTIGVPCEVYSRCVGYIRPINQWNVGKQEEWSERKTYKIKWG